MTYKNHVFLLLLFAAMICSCANDVKETKPKKMSEIEQLKFDIGFPTSGINRYFTDGQSEYLAFVDFNTSKKISVHSINNQKQLFSIPLKELMQTDRFFDFAIVDLNTFVLLSKYTNKVYVIDRFGKLIDKIDYSKYLLDGIELAPPISVTNGVFSAGIDYTHPDFPDNPGVDDYIESYKKRYIFPLTFNVHDFQTEGESIQVALDSIYSRFTNDNEMAIEGNHILNTPSNILFSSIYSDSIYIFNTEYELDKIVPVISEFIKINTRPITFQQYLENPESISTNIRGNSFVSSLLYDSFKDQYYCFVRDKMIDELLPFSIIIFDAAFNKLDEIKMDHQKVFPFGFVGENGLYLLSTDKRDKLKKTYTLFNYE